MSGSPIYVNDGGTEKLVGALSYGDWFTKSNYGLATPIDAMTVIEGYPSMSITSLKTLDEPVVIEGKAVNSIVVTEDPSGFEKAAENGTFVARPLAAQYLGGLDPSLEAVPGIQEACRVARRQSRSARARAIEHGVDVQRRTSNRDPASRHWRPGATYGQAEWAPSRT